VLLSYDLNGKPFTQSSLSVLVGVHDLNANATDEPSQRRYTVQRVIVHENYTSASNAYDIMLFQLSSRIHYNDQTRPVCVDKSIFPAGKTCVVTGFGSTVNVGELRNKLFALATFISVLAVHRTVSS